MARRRYRRARRHRVLRATVAVAVVLAAAWLLPLLVHLAVRLLPLLLILAAVGGGGYWAALRRRPAAKVTAAPPASVPAPRRPAADARARRNRWAPPARPRMVTISVSPECAEGACAMCHGTGCACPCEHDSRVIVAMNTARADDDERIPF